MEARSVAMAAQLKVYHLQCTRFDLVVKRKLRRRQLTEDGSVELTGRDLREGKVGERTMLGAPR
jgi:hypothetical protein